MVVDYHCDSPSTSSYWAWFHCAIKVGGALQIASRYTSELEGFGDINARRPMAAWTLLSLLCRQLRAQGRAAVKSILPNPLRVVEEGANEWQNAIKKQGPSTKLVPTPETVHR